MRIVFDATDITALVWKADIDEGHLEEARWSIFSKCIKL